MSFVFVNDWLDGFDIRDAVEQLEYTYENMMERDR